MSHPVNRCFCEECGWRGTTDDLLRAASPFDPLMEISACPKCKETADTTRMTCEEPECWHEATAGTPHPTGYKRHCHEHPPRGGRT